MTFAGATLQGSVTLNATANITSTGTITDSGSNFTLTKTGTGRFDYTSTTAPTLGGAAGTNLSGTGVNQWNLPFTVALTAANNIAFGGTFASPTPITLSGGAAFSLNPNSTVASTGLFTLSNPVVVGVNSTGGLYGYQNANNIASVVVNDTFSGAINLGGLLTIGNPVQTAMRAEIYSTPAISRSTSQSPAFGV